MSKVDKTFVNGQPLGAEDLNSINEATGAVGEATTPAQLASVVAQGIHDNTEAQKKVTFGAGTAAELASVVAEQLVPLRIYNITGQYINLDDYNTNGLYLHNNAQMVASTPTFSNSSTSFVMLCLDYSGGIRTTQIIFAGESGEAFIRFIENRATSVAWKKF